jgi:hypothetical protein
MAQILDPLPNNQNNSVLCCYVNATNQIQVVRITNIVNWYFERVVFPGQRLVFEALLDAMLEIHTGMMASAILSETIPCDRLSHGDSDDEEDELELEAVPTPAVAMKKDEHQGKESSNILHFKPILASAH